MSKTKKATTTLTTSATNRMHPTCTSLEAGGAPWAVGVSLADEKATQQRVSPMDRAVSNKNAPLFMPAVRCCLLKADFIVL